MQQQNQKSIPKTSKRPGRNSLPRNQRKGENGRAKTRANADGFRGIGFHLLEKELRTIPLMEISLMAGDGDSVDLLKTIDTESKQLQAITDLYAIVKAQPKYKRLKEPDWTVDTPPLAVIYWLLKKLGPLAKGNNWTIDTFGEGAKTRFCFVVYKAFNRQLVKEREEYVPLDFLPVLKKRDLPLHDLIIDIIALVSRCNKVPLWDEDGDFSKMLEDLLSQPINDSNSVLYYQYVSYKSGPAAEYLKLIRSRRKIVGFRDIVKQVENYDAKSQRKQSMIWWVKSGLQLAQTGNNILANNYVPNYITAKTISPYQQYKFIWSIHDHDVLKAKVYNKLRKEAKNGDFFPVKFTITKPGQKVKPVNEDNYAEILYEFMSTGTMNLCYRWREYFYKKQFDTVKTPAEYLLETIERNEIKITA